MYRDGDIIAVYKLDRPGHSSLAGCADACLLNWRLTLDTSQALDTDCSVSDHCPMTTGILVADRKCEAFMFNRNTGVCTLLSAEQSTKLVRSSKFWSGKLICEDMTSVDDWAQGVISRRSPPPPPPPMTQATWPASAVAVYANLDTIDLVFTPPSTLGDDETNISYNVRCNAKDSGCRPASASDIKNFVTLDCSNLATCGGSGATSITASLNNAQSTLPITATPSDGYDCYIISMNRFLSTVSDGVCSARLRFVPEAPTAPTGLSVRAGVDDLSVSFTAVQSDDGVPTGLYSVICVDYGDAAGCDGTQRIGSTAPNPAQVSDPSAPIVYTFPSSGGSDVYYDCSYSAVNQYANGLNKVCSSKKSILCDSGNVCKENVSPGAPTGLTYSYTSSATVRIGFSVSNPEGYPQETYMIFCHVSNSQPSGYKCVDTSSLSFRSGAITRPATGTTASSGTVSGLDPWTGYVCYVEASNAPDNKVCSDGKYVNPYSVWSG